MYQLSIDVHFFKKGMRHKEVIGTITILICMFNPFTIGFPMYIFENLCRQHRDVEFGDAKLKIVLCP